MNHAGNESYSVAEDGQIVWNHQSNAAGGNATHPPPVYLRRNLSDTLETRIYIEAYEKNSKSEDDTIVTLVGNFLFSKLGNIFFKLTITDILYTFVLGKTSSIKKLNLKQNDFRLCVELPIKAKYSNMKIISSPAHERVRIGGKKKVNAISDGFLILSAMAKYYFNI